MGGVQFKISLKKWTFEPKSGGLFKKNPKNGTFHITWGSIQEWGCNQADMVYFTLNYANSQNISTYKFRDVSLDKFVQVFTLHTAM